MYSIKLNFFHRTVVMLFVVLALFLGCATEEKVPESVLNTPEHHTLSGFKLIKKGYPNHAKREFALALQLNPDYFSAHRGMGMVYIMNGNFQLALDSMQSATDVATTRRDKAISYVGFMYLYTMQKDSGWLKKVEAEFSKEMLLIEDLPEAYYQMAIAYKQASRLTESEEAFKKVVTINKGLVPEATKELQELRK